MERRQSGQALIETILVGLLMLVPLIWGLGVLAELHRSALAATSGAREAGFEASRTGDLASADRAVRRAVEQAFLDHQLDPGDAVIRWEAPAGLVRGGAVEIRVSYPVTVLRAPLIGSVSGPSVWVDARHVARIDLYRSRE